MEKLKEITDKLTKTPILGGVNVDKLKRELKNKKDAYRQGVTK